MLLVAEPFNGVDDIVWANGRLFVTPLDQAKSLEPDGKITKRLKRLPGAYDVAVSPKGDCVDVVVPGHALIVSIDIMRLKVINRLRTDPCASRVALFGSLLLSSTRKCEHLATITSIDARKGGEPKPTGLT